MKADIWNVLHDGSILEVSGTVPGDVQMAVWIEYLRNRFPDPGERIIVTLHGCSALSYKPFEEDETITVPGAIGRAQPEILRAKDWTDASVVECVGGTIRVTASDFSIALDSGRTITFEELCAVSEAYWAQSSQD